MVDEELPPDADSLTRGMTVRVVQPGEDVESTDAEPILGEIAHVIGDEPEGPKVELQSGVVGHVTELAPDE